MYKYIVSAACLIPNYIETDGSLYLHNTCCSNDISLMYLVWITGISMKVSDIDDLKRVEYHEMNTQMPALSLQPRKYENDFFKDILHNHNPNHK